MSEFRNLPLDGAHPYPWLDATDLKARENGRVLSMAMVVAVAVRASGEREILGQDLGPAEDGTLWLSFLRGLVARGLHDVQRVIGLRQAIPAALATASWLSGGESVSFAMCAKDYRRHPHDLGPTGHGGGCHPTRHE